MTITVTEVPVPEALDIVAEMADDHWSEVPFGQWQMELDLDTPKYHTLYDNGISRCLVAYDGEVPVGYISLLSDTMLQHADYVQCVTDAFYVDPAYRQRGVFQALLIAAEEFCRGCGIDYLSFGVNPTFPDWKQVQLYLAQHDFHFTELTMTKRLE